MKHTVIFLFICAAVYYTTKGSWANHTAAQLEFAFEQVLTDPNSRLPERFKKLPIGEHIYVSASPCRENYVGVGELDLLTTVRLNGDGQDRGCMSIEDEAELADRYEMRLLYFNIEGNGRGLKRAVRVLKDGYVYLHCKHGVHRAILVAACYMLSEGMPYDEVLAWTGWTEGNNPVYTNPDYAKYVTILKEWGAWYAV